MNRRGSTGITRISTDSAKQQLLGGASGALIVEGIERAKKASAGLPERVFIIRDQDLINPNAPPSKSEPVVPKFMIDRDGDAANNGTGFGKPAKDLSINYVPVPYPDYPPATIEMKPGERQLWRVLNASAITYLNLAVLFNRVPQPLGLVAMDGVPMNQNDAAERLRRPADAYRPAARSARGIHRDRSAGGRNGPAGHENCRYRPRRGKRSQPHAGEDYRFAGCTGTRSRLQSSPEPCLPRPSHGSEPCHRCVYAIYIFPKS